MKKSDYLQVVPNNGNYVSYHSLYGNLKILNPEAMHVLLRFNDPVSLEDALQSMPAEQVPAIQSIVETFQSLGFLVQEGFDERSIYAKSLEERKAKASSGKFIGGIQLNVSNVCNFQCEYCFVEPTEARRQCREKFDDGRLMTFQTAKLTIDSVIKYVKTKDQKGLVVKFFGREPFTNWKLMKKIMEHYGRGENHGVEIFYAVTTNGSLIDEKVAAVLSDYQVHTTVSVDGTEEANNAIRKNKKAGATTFDAITRGLELLQRYDIKRNLSAVLMEKNFHSFQRDFIDMASEIGSTEVQILLGMQGDFLGTLGVDAVVDKLYDIYSYGLEKNIAVTGYWHNAFGQLYNTIFDKDDGSVNRGTIDSCTATGYQISVEPSGDIYPCKAMSYYLGRINDFASILKSPDYEKVIMRYYGNVRECKGCSIEGFCQGVCLGNIEERFNGDIYRVDDRYCQIYRGITRKILGEVGFEVR
jgi:uncharacterized protein